MENKLENYFERESYSSKKINSNHVKPLKKRLERIFWEEGNWFNEKGKLVNPKPVGKAFVIELCRKFDNKRYEELINKSINEKLNEYMLETNQNNIINAYSIGEDGEEEYTQHFCCPLSFYKI